MKITLIYILVLFYINIISAFGKVDVFDAIKEDKKNIDESLHQNPELDIFTSNSEFNSVFFADYNIKLIRLRILNKITAKIYEFKINIGSFIKFDNLEILAEKCSYLNPDDQKDSLALLHIKDLSKQDNQREVFYGWIFSNSPALSTLEHPFYDITLIKCEE